MAKNFEEVVELPSGASLAVNGNVMALTLGPHTVESHFNSMVVTVTVRDGKAFLKCIGKPTRVKVASTFTAKAHLKNMLAGLEKGFSRHLQVLYAHFPVSIEVKEKDVLIKNFLGEKLPRTAAIQGNAKVEVKGQDIFISGNDKYAVGQTANNIMRAVRITQKDRRVFQDGIYVIE